MPAKAKALRFRDYFFLWSSLGVGLLVFLAGSYLVPGLSLVEVLAVSLLGSVIGSLLLASAGLVGSRYGVPTMVSLRAVMGRQGSYIPTILNLVQLIGWTAFEIMVMSQAAGNISGPFLGGLTGAFWVLLFGVFCWLLAMGGPLVVVRKWLEKFAAWIVYGLAIWITYLIFSTPGILGAMLRPGDGSMPLLLALDLVIAMPISWWPLVSDYNRFARTEKGAFGGTFLGYTLTNTWFYFMGAALMVVLGAGNIIASILGLLFGWVAMVLILVNETDNGFADIYSAAVSFQNIFPRVKQWKFITLVAAAGTFLASALPLMQYQNFLLVIGALFVPLLGVLFSDYILIRRQSYSLDEFYGVGRRVKARPMAAWVIGLIVYFFIYVQCPSLGASLPAFGTAALAHLLLQKM